MVIISADLLLAPRVCFADVKTTLSGEPLLIPPTTGTLFGIPTTRLAPPPDPEDGAIAPAAAAGPDAAAASTAVAASAPTAAAAGLDAAAAGSDAAAASTAVADSAPTFAAAAAGFNMFFRLPDTFADFVQDIHFAVIKAPHRLADTVGKLVTQTHSGWYELACPHLSDPVMLRRRGQLVCKSPCCNIPC